MSEIAEFARHIREERKRERDSVASFCNAVDDDDQDALFEAIKDVDDCFVWKRTLGTLVKKQIRGSPALRSVFLDVYLESGDHIRNEVGNDLLLTDALRLLTPIYDGAPVTLFRGESFFNRSRRTYGISWSDEIDVARHFAENGPWRTFKGGSVLLAADAPAEAIICAPKFVNNRFAEAEFIVDRRRLKNVRIITRYSELSIDEFNALKEGGGR